MASEIELLQRYVDEGSQTAFAEIVQRYLGFVYNSALRQLNGDSHGARDVAQVVFADLARKAPVLAQRRFLGAWLHTRTRHAALQQLRTERRQKAREQKAHFMEELTADSSPTLDWERLRPVIDGALQGLNTVDREAVILRYFEGQSYSAIGVRMNLSADGARSRVDRALAKMQVRLARLGVTSTVAALALALTGQTAAGAPVNLASTVTDLALQAAAKKTGGAATIIGTLNLMKASSVLLTTSLLANVVFAYWWTGESTAPSLQAVEINPEGWRNILQTASAQPSAALFDAALNGDLSDPYVVGRRLRAEGFGNGVVAAGIMAAYWHEAGRYVDDSTRLRPWNLSPTAASADALAKRSQEEIRAESQRMTDLWTELYAVLADFGLDYSGNTIAEGYPFLDPDKAVLVRQIENEFGASSSGRGSLADRAAAESAMEARILSVLSSEEAAAYFRETSTAARSVRNLVAELSLPAETLNALSDNAVALERAERTARGGSGSENAAVTRMDFLRRTRAILGDEKFTRVMARMELEEFESVDSIYRDAQFSPSARADRFFSVLQYLGEQVQTRNNAVLESTAAERLRQNLVAGLSPGQVSSFEGTTIGRRLRNSIETGGR